MTDVLIDRELLEHMRNFTVMHDSGVAGVLRGQIDAILANPTRQGEAVGVVGYLLTKGNQLSLMPAGSSDLPLMTVAQHQRILAGVRQQLAERDADIIELARGANAIQDALEQQRDKLAGLLERIANHHIDGNIRPTVRDCVNGRPDVQDIYGYCDEIAAEIEAALSELTP